MAFIDKIDMQANMKKRPSFFARHPLLLKLFAGLVVIPCFLYGAAMAFSWCFDPVNSPDIVVTALFGIAMICIVFLFYCGAYCCDDLDDFGLKDLQKYKGRFVLGVVLLSSLLVYFFQNNVARIPPVFVEHVSYEQIPFGGIPKGGTDYSYRRFPHRKVFIEYTITEKSFDDWIASERLWESRTEITEENPEHIWGWIRESRATIVVTDGIRVHYGKEAGGNTIFDRSTNRAYYWTHYNSDYKNMSM